jgi:hypothetical protein
LAQNQNRLLKVLLALCIFRLWIMPLPSSFWVDETGTMFVVRQGAHHPSFAVAPQVPASIYYWLPRAMDPLLPFVPHAEVLYRVPSLLAMALALFIIARIAAHLIHPRAAWFAVFACLALRGFDYEADNARPYALGILVVSASALFLIRWLDRGRFLDAASFVICAALIWRVHLLYWPFYIVLFLYALTRPARRRASLIVFGLVGVTLIPVSFDALSLSRQAAAHVMAPVPPPLELFRALKLGLIAVTLCIALILRSGAGAGRPRPALTLILVWWLIPPFALYAFSVLTGNSVFVHRYLSFGLPGAALAATAAAALFLPEQKWHWAAAILGAGVLILLGDWRQPWPPHHNSNWRAAAAAINSLPDEPVVCPSPFLEARPPAWSPTYALPGFLYAHLAAYPVHGRLILFPFQTSPATEQWASQLNLGPRFVIYGQAPSVEFWRNWYLNQPRFSGWTSRKLGDFGDVDAIVLATRK